MKTKQIHFLITEKEHKQIKLKATRMGITITELIKTALLSYPQDKVCKELRTDVQ